MNGFLGKLTELPFGGKLLGIVIIHLVINVFSGLIFIFDDFSFLNQLVHSIIHLFFFIAVIQLLYIEEKYNVLIKRIGWISIVLVLILNLIPSSQELVLHDNGFVPWWAQAPQVQFGWPNVFVRVFNTEFQNLREDNIANPLIHYSTFFLNLYIISILISLELKLVSWGQKRFKEV